MAELLMEAAELAVTVATESVEPTSSQGSSM